MYIEGFFLLCAASSSAVTSQLNYPPFSVDLIFRWHCIIKACRLRHNDYDVTIEYLYLINVYINEWHINNKREISKHGGDGVGAILNRKLTVKLSALLHIRQRLSFCCVKHPFPCWSRLALCVNSMCVCHRSAWLLWDAHENSIERVEFEFVRMYVCICMYIGNVSVYSMRLYIR